MQSFESQILEEYINNIRKENKTLVVDIDGVVASIVEDGDYSKAQPIKKNISVLNNLRESGLKIIYYTARGSVSGIDWEDLTKEQFKRWKIKFDELKFGKPAADLYIDDKAATPPILLELEKEIKNKF